jgi:selenocysteine lyase/cysteine desulfurase
MTTPEIRAQFSPDPSIIYFDAPTYGLPPNKTIAALQRALSRWQAGTADWIEEWDREADVARSLFARLIGAPESWVGVIPTVSVAAGTVAASLPPGSKVLIPTEEFTSNGFPFLVAQQAGRVTVEEVPFDQLADAISDDTDLVAFSLVRSQSGETADLGAIVSAAKAVGAQIFIDGTQAFPFVSVKDYLDDIDYLACHGYKHLLCPRGTAFFVIHPRRMAETLPYNANWRSARPSYQSHYGTPMNLAEDAARYDVSLAWHSWVGARQSLELLVEWQEAGELAKVLDLSKRLAEGLSLEPPSSSIVSFRAPDADEAERVLTQAGIRCASRGGNVRLGLHIYNTPEEIERAIAVISPLRSAVVAD